METELKELMEILRNERELLITKTKWGIYASGIIIVTTFINVYALLSNRNEYLFPTVGPYIEQITMAFLLAIIVIGSLFLLVFAIRNYRRYQGIEKRVDDILKNIHGKIVEMKELQKKFE